MAKRPRLTRAWHRTLGVILALPLLLVSLTGVLLNHTVALRLDERRVEWGPVLERYGMALEGQPRSFAADGLTVSQWGKQSFLDARLLGGSESELAGGVMLGEEVVVLAFETLPMEVYQPDGLLILQIDDVIYPGDGIERIGRTGQGRLAVQARDGQVYRFSEDLFVCERLEESGNIVWSEAIIPSPRLQQEMRQAYRGEGVSWSRVLLDLHSGRILGPLGPWLLDLSVLGLIVLVITGLKLSLRPPRL